ncbi:MAG TPA: aminoglycoside phosphotransferase family protein [Actinospica sp.]|nr:aminoglycoside phosphotransferase family protein [Actinospica sp.]
MPLVLTPDNAGPLLADILPDHGPISEVRRFDEGSVTGAYRVSFADDELRPVVVKVYAPESRGHAAKEARALHLLRDRGIFSVPRVLGFRKAVDVLDGGACTVLSLMRGRTLSSVAARLTPDQEREVWRQLGTILRRIHEVPMGAYGYINGDIVDPAPDNTTHMTRIFAALFAEYRGRAGEQALADRLEAHVAVRAAAFAQCERPVLCHGDYHESNILVTRESDGRYRVTGVIDPENMHAGDPLMDVVRTSEFSIADDAAKRAALLEGYGVGGADWPEAWRARMHLYRIALALELHNWFSATGASKHLPGLDRDLRMLAEAG